jgi:hypothetical protein
MGVLKLNFKNKRSMVAFVSTNQSLQRGLVKFHKKRDGLLSFTMFKKEVTGTNKIVYIQTLVLFWKIINFFRVLLLGNTMKFQEIFVRDLRV